MKKSFSVLMLLLTCLLAQSQNDTIYPTDTLVNPSYFSSSNILANWTMGYCSVNITGTDTTFAPCYIVTYEDYYTASIDLCPDNLDEVGGMGLHLDSAWVLDSNLFNQMELDGSNIINDTNGYWINYNNLTSGVTIDGGPGSHKYCIEADLFLGTTNTWYQRFEILLGPIDIPGPFTIPYSTAGTIGVLKAGVLLEYTPPSSNSTPAMNGGIIPIDFCGWHPEPAGFGHFHAVPTGINVALDAVGVDTSVINCSDIAQGNGSELAGFTFEGIPIYGPFETDLSMPTGLDACNGHFGPTPEFPGGVYHYHVSATDVINAPPCRANYMSLNAWEYGEWTGGGMAIEFHENADLINVFPNPVSEGVLNIEGDYDHFTIYTVDGALVVESNGKSISSLTQINLSKFPAGMYFLNAEKGNEMTFKKIVIN